jgi:hypothetical protein
VSRHRSPSGRHAHPRRLPPAVAAPGAQLRPAPARPAHAATSAALRNGLSAAAVTGGALALVTPAVALVDAQADEGVLRLSAGETSPGEIVAAGPVAAEGFRMVASLAPVTAVAEPPPPAVDAAELLKAVGLEDLARQAEEQRRAREDRANCDVGLGGLGRVKPWVRDAARFLSCLYDLPDLIGVANRARASDHPSGHAVDLMVRGERGDRIAECALANQEELGISYVIWKQRVNYGDGWERMSDRGGDTANHFDHVHISFDRSAPAGDPSGQACE